MGLENRIIYDLVQVIEGVCQTQQAMIRDKLTENLYVIPAAQTRDKNAVTGEQVKELCDKLKEDFDYIFIDSPAGIEQGFRNAMVAADRAIVVTTPDVAAIRDADRVIGFIEAAGLTKPELIINRVRPGHGTPRRHDDYRRHSGPPLRSSPRHHTGRRTDSGFRQPGCARST